MHRVFFGSSTKNEYTQNKDSLTDRAYELFLHHLEQLRQHAEVKTICMFNEVFYLTDTGRRWDGWKVYGKKS